MISAPREADRPSPGDVAAIAVLGTGLIGASIALAARRAGIRVAGWDLDPAVSARAGETGGLEVAASLVDAVEGVDLVSALFTVTDDLRSAFPAEAARRMGLGVIPLMCAREIPVEGSMPRVVRILMHFYTERGATEVVPVYLDGAEALRDDLGAS